MDHVSILDRLLSLPSENEVFELKEAKTNFDFDDLGKYFSALSNEANLLNKEAAYLIFGIRNNGSVCGTSFRETGRRTAQSLKKEIADQTNNRISFIDIVEFEYKEKRVIMFIIPPAPHGIPISRKGHFYGRDHESLVAMNLEKIERIRKQDKVYDRSKELCPEATLDDLDEEAITKARRMYIVKNSTRIEEINTRDNEKFLDKAKLSIKGVLTNSALLLLGKPESNHYLTPGTSQITRSLSDKRDYEHFYCPLILAVDKVFEKVRNLKYRYLAEDGLFPEETDMYEGYVLRELLNNAIAHQDYTLGGRINIVEFKDKITITNLGSFIPGSIENVVINDTPSDYYRNDFLVCAMVNLNMIDTIGSGIKRSFEIQSQKYFPLPDYNLQDDKVEVTLYGKILDINYARQLIKMPSLSLTDIILLDKVQKHQPINQEQAEYLKKKNLIEGRKPNYHISLNVAQHTSLISEYVMQQALIKEQREKVYKFISGHKKGIFKRDILEFMKNAKIFEQGLDIDKQENRLQNILTTLKDEKRIYNIPQGKNTIRLSKK